jgi:hypothetical protein
MIVKACRSSGFCKYILRCPATRARLHFRQSHMNRHGIRIRLEHPLNGFQMNAHQA